MNAGKCNVFVSVGGAAAELLARELHTDPAATPVTQNTRLPGFFNHKRAQPHLVTIEYLDTRLGTTPKSFRSPRSRLPRSHRGGHSSRNAAFLPSSVQSDTSRQCHRPSQATTATSTPFASAVGWYEASP